jgi:hypothetical protein
MAFEDALGLVEGFLREASCEWLEGATCESEARS